MRALLVALVVALLAACAHRGREAPTDAELKARVQQALAGHEDLEIRYLTLDVNSGVVTISGMVHSLAQRRRIEALAKAVKGVDQVLNNLVIQE
jgi:osmotically-inducible protein OsmY